MSLNGVGGGYFLTHYRYILLAIHDALSYKYAAKIANNLQIKCDFVKNHLKGDRNERFFNGLYHQ